MFCQILIADPEVFFGLVGKRAVRITADEPFKALDRLLRNTLIPVNGLPSIKIATAYLVNYVGNGLVIGMKVFEFFVGGDGFFVLLAVVMGIAKSKLSNDGVFAEGVPIPQFFESLNGLGVVLVLRPSCLGWQAPGPSSPPWSATRHNRTALRLPRGSSQHEGLFSHT